VSQGATAHWDHGTDILTIRVVACLKRLLQNEHAIGLIGFYTASNGCTLMAVTYQTISTSKVQSSKAVLCEVVELLLLKYSTHSTAILLLCSCGCFELTLGFTIVLKGKKAAKSNCSYPSAVMSLTSPASAL
jgi:hypothetical protein